MPQLEQATTVLCEPTVRAFLSRELYHYVDRARFDGLEMPPGVAVDEMWELLCAVRGVVGTRVLSELSDIGGRGELWFVRTPEMVTALAGVAGLSSETSHVALVLDTQPERVLRSRPFVDELCAVLRRDGLEVGPEEVSGLVRGDRAPDGPVDALLCNALSILGDIVSHAHAGAAADIAEALGVGPVRDKSDASDALRAMYRRLDEGVGPCACAGPRRLEMPYFRSGCSSDAVLASVVDLYLTCGERDIDPLVAFVSNADVFWEYAPFERWNGMMELLVRVAFFAHIGHLGVAFGPFCDLALRWERGEMAPGEAPYRIEETGLECSLGVDVTLFYTQKIRLLARSVRLLDAVLADEERRSARLKGAVSCDARLNHRQRDLIARLVENPTLETDARSHAACYGVSAMTARTDLQKLVEFDYLYRRAPDRADKAAVYAACPDLPAKLARLRRVAER